MCEPLFRCMEVKRLYIRVHKLKSLWTDPQTRLSQGKRNFLTFNKFLDVPAINSYILLALCSNQFPDTKNQMDYFIYFCFTPPIMKGNEEKLDT